MDKIRLDGGVSSTVKLSVSKTELLGSNPSSPAISLAPARLSFAKAPEPDSIETAQWKRPSQSQISPAPVFSSSKVTPERLAAFLRDVRSEMRKVITPSREEVQSTTLIVIACVFLFAAYFAIVDFLVSNSVDSLFRHLAKH